MEIRRIIQAEQKRLAGRFCGRATVGGGTKKGKYWPRHVEIFLLEPL
jgi:hypothetical protein